MTTQPAPTGGAEVHDLDWLAVSLRELGLTERQVRLALLDARFVIAYYIELCARPDDRWGPQ